MKYNLDLEIGSLYNLKGNGVAYWNNLSYNKDNSILAVNFMISVFPFDDNLVITTFPLAVFDTREEFMFYISQSQCDLIFLGDSKLEPLGDTFILNKSQYKELNQMMQTYLDHFRDKIFQKSEHYHPQQKLSIINAWINRLKNRQNDTNPLSQNLDGKIRSMVATLNIKGLNQSDIDYFLFLNDHQSPYRFEVMKLYLKKFLALIDEQYEEMDKLNKEIQKLKKEFNF